MNKIAEIFESLDYGPAPESAEPALAWLAGRAGVCSLVLGARNEAQLKDNLASASLVLTAEERAMLDDVSLLQLLYPYWHQLNAASRLGAADLSLMAPHVARMKPRL